jgi:hypothetical protein
MSTTLEPPLARTVAAVAWPSFLAAAVLELLVFAVVDPQALHGFSGAPLPLSPTGIYSVAFLAFWAVGAAACALTLALRH